MFLLFCFMLYFGRVLRFCLFFVEFAVLQSISEVDNCPQYCPTNKSKPCIPR